MLLAHLGFNNRMSSMKKATYEVELKGKKQIATRTMEFTFEKPKDFKFNAGQHIRMTLLNPTDSDAKGNRRFMTLANTPAEKDLVIAMRMTDSAFKNVLGQMQIGEKVVIEILLRSPHGSFVIHEDSSKPAVFLAGGIGIVPAYSIIKDAIERKLQHKIYLFYSNRRPEDAPYLKDLQKLANQYPSFKLIATMTHPEKSAPTESGSDKLWDGEIGYIDKKMLQKYLVNLGSPVYYIVGLTEMVNAMKALVSEIGISRDNIRSEDFSAMKMGLMNMTDKPKGIKNYFILVATALIILVIISVHLSAAASLSKTFSLQNLSYLTIGLIFLIVIFKLFVVFKFKHFLVFKRGNKKILSVNQNE